MQAIEEAAPRRGLRVGHIAVNVLVNVGDDARTTPSAGVRNRASLAERELRLPSEAHVMPTRSTFFSTVKTTARRMGLTVFMK